MKIKNDLVRIKVGKKKYDFHNLILNEYLRRFALGQMDKEHATTRYFYQLRNLSYILLKFDTPLSELNENSELSNYDFDICIVNKAKYSQNLSEKNVIVQYSYEFEENDFVLDKNIASQGGDSSTAIKYLKEFYGRKIMAIGFAGHWWYKDPTPVCAVLDTSNYNIYLEENQEFSITRRDIITTDAEFYSNDKDKVPAPVHLAPYGVPQIINQPDIVDSEGTINSFYNNAYGALYSIGKGYVQNVIEEEKIIGEDAKVVNNGTSLTISSVENEDVGTEALYPSEDLYPIGKFIEEIQTSEKGIQVSIEGNEEDAFVKIDGKSTQVTEYEPYGASPSPEFPSPIKSVGDDVNLLKLPDGKYEKNGITAVISNGKITINGTSTGVSFINIPINLSLSEIFSFSAGNTAMGNSGSAIRLQISGSNYKEIDITTENNKLENISTYGNYNSLLLRISANTTIINGVIKPKIQKGTVATPYSKYGEGTVTIEQRGKNLFDASKIANTAIEVLDNGKTIKMPIVTSGNGITTTNKKLSELCPKLKVGDTVYLLFDKTPDSFNKFIHLNTSSFTWVKGNSRTITQKDLDSEVVMYGNRYVDGQTEQVILTNFRIVKNADDDYEPYFSKDYVIPLSAPLRSLPNGTKDTIEEDGIHRRVGIKVLNGSEYITAYNNIYYIRVPDKKGRTEITKGKILCSHFKETDKTGYNVMSVGEMWENYYTDPNVNIFFNYDNGVGGVDNFKDYLAEQYANGTPLTVNYELSEEVVDPFTDEQLEIINSIETQKGTNIFSIDSELETEIEVTEYKSPLYPIKDNHKYIILKYKVWQEVATGEYTEEDGYIQEITDTGYYYHQAIPLEEYGTLNATIKYERG